MELTYLQERELHNVVLTTTIRFVGDVDEWRELVKLMNSHTAEAMIRSLENVCAQYEDGD